MPTNTTKPIPAYPRNACDFMTFTHTAQRIHHVIAAVKPPSEGTTTTDTLRALFFVRDCEPPTTATVKAVADRTPAIAVVHVST